MKITTGFLTGNLFSGWSSDELEQIDARKSVNKFRQMVEDAIRERYPQADLTVTYQHAEGVTPYDLLPFVVDDEGEADGEIAQEIADIQADVFLEEWWIDASGTQGGIRSQGHTGGMCEEGSIAGS